MRDCPHCGTPLPDGSRFCGECGRPVAGDAAGETAIAPPLVRRWPPDPFVLIAILLGLGGLGLALGGARPRAHAETGRVGVRMAAVRAAAPARRPRVDERRDAPLALRLRAPRLV